MSDNLEVLCQLLSEKQDDIFSKNNDKFFNKATQIALHDSQDLGLIKKGFNAAITSVLQLKLRLMC